MPNLSEVDPNQNLKILIYGEAGAGKTVFATSFPGPIFVADFDGKVSSAASFYAAEQERLKQIEFENYQVQGEPRLAVAYTNWCKKLYALEQMAKEETFPFQTIVIDSLTTYVERMMEKVMADNPGIKRWSPGVPVLQDYGVMNTHFKHQIARILALPCNVIMTAHIKMDKDEMTGEIIRGPLLSPSLAAHLPILFFEVYRAYAEEREKKISYFAQTKPDARFRVIRSQIQGLPNPMPLAYEGFGFKN